MAALSSQVCDSIIPLDVMRIYDDLRIKTRYRENWKEVKEVRLWKELVFCILSANVSYELVKSTVDVLDKRKLLDSYWLINIRNSAQILSEELGKPLFEPIKKDGEGRKYRYPRRGREIVEAARIIYLKNGSIKNMLEKAESDTLLRNNLAETIPGLGFKEASHFLRNIGFSNSLAIIDIHILDFISQYLNVDLKKRSVASIKEYLLFEKILQNFSEYHGLNLAIFDLAVWFYMRDKYQ